MSDARVPLHDLDAFECAVYHEVAGKVCQSPEAFAQLSRAVRYLVENQIWGDFVECGVFQGASIVCIIRTLQAVNYQYCPSIWLYDTFEGMPKPEPIDKFHSMAEGEDLKRWERERRGENGSDWVRASMDVVKSNIESLRYRGIIQYVRGMVEETIPGPGTAPGPIALLRLDTDFYSSTKHELVHLYPRVVSGGVVIIDDYGAFRGAQKAVDEYIKENGLKVLLARIDEHVRMWVKP